MPTGFPRRRAATCPVVYYTDTCVCTYGNVSMLRLSRRHLSFVTVVGMGTCRTNRGTNRGTGGGTGGCRTNELKSMTVGPIPPLKRIV